MGETYWLQITTSRRVLTNSTVNNLEQICFLLKGQLIWEDRRLLLDYNLLYFDPAMHYTPNFLDARLHRFKCHRFYPPGYIQYRSSTSKEGARRRRWKLLTF